jgi:hypothetical protein
LLYNALFYNVCKEMLLNFSTILLIECILIFCLLDVSLTKSMTKDAIAAYPCKKDAPSVVNIKEVYAKVQSRLVRNEYIHDFINGIEGFPSQDVLRWINGLRLDAEIAIAKNKNKTGYPCKIISFTVGFYLKDVPKGKTLPQYVEHTQEECGVAFVNEAFYQDSDPHGWIIVLVNTLPENLPFSSASLSNDIQRAAHILKAAAPLLFPCTDFIIYGDTKCSYKETSFIDSRFFPNNRFVTLWNNNKNDEIRLYVLQHPRRFFGLLKSEFEKTIHHVRFNRGETEPTQ